MNNLVRSGALLVTSFLFAVILSEAVLFTIGDEVPSYKKSESARYVVFREHVPNSEIEFLRPGQRGEFDVLRIDIDANGFIKSTLNESRDKPDFTFLFLGGSTTETALVDPSQRFVDLVGRRVSSELDVQVETLNAGVSGNNSLHSLVSFLAKGIAVDPDFVVVMHNVNDLMSLRWMGSYWGENHPRPAVGRFPGSFESMIEKIKSVIRLSIPRLHSRMAALISKGSSGEWAAVQNKTTMDANLILNNFHSSLSSLVAISRCWGVEPILMTQPSLISHDSSIFLSEFQNADPGKFADLHSQANDLIRQVGEDWDVDVIDLAMLVPPDRRYFYDSVHVNNEGSALIASFISEYIIEHQLLSARVSGTSKEFSKCGF